jgi:hypothetical protein
MGAGDGLLTGVSVVGNGVGDGVGNGVGDGGVGDGVGALLAGVGGRVGDAVVEPGEGAGEGAGVEMITHTPHSFLQFLLNFLFLHKAGVASLHDFFPMLLLTLNLLGLS